MGFKQAITDARYNVNRASNNFFSKFNSRLAGPKAFLNSNTLIAKIAVLILVLIAFVLALRAGVAALTWLFSPSHDPVLVKGAGHNCKEQTRVPQDPTKNHAQTILRSVNQRDGIEFTWSVWVYLSGLEYKAGQRRHIFSKGNDYVDKSTGMMSPNNAPGLYIHPTKNAFIVVMNTYKQINEEVVINDIPLNKWLNVMIRVEGNIMDVYVNGIIAVRHKLSGVPKQNYGDVWVTANGGYDGRMSELQYFDYALNTTEIMKIVNDGPDLSVKTREPAVPHYFALKWYFNQ